MTLGIMTLGIMTLSIMTVSITIKKHDTRHNDPQHYGTDTVYTVMLSVVYAEFRKEAYYADVIMHSAVMLSVM
jgi:hypothetical protein